MKKKLKLYEVFLDRPGQGWKMHLKAYSERTALNRANRINPCNPTTIDSVIELEKITNNNLNTNEIYNSLDSSFTTEQKNNIKKIFLNIVNKQCVTYDSSDVYMSDLISKDHLLEAIDNL